MSDEKKRNWFLRFLRVVICLLVLVVVLVWVAKIWIVPSVVRSMAGSHLDDVWFGTVEIDDVDVNVFGPSYVRGVTLRDSLDRKWVNVPEVRIDVVWDGFVPRPRFVTVAVINVSPQFVDGKCTVPLKRSESSGDGADIVEIINDLKDVEMDVGVATVQAVNDASATNRTLDGIVLPAELARILSRTSIIFPSIEWKGGKLSFAKALGEIGDDRISLNIGGGLQSDRSITLAGDCLVLRPEEAINGAFKVRFQSGGAAHFEVSLAGQIQADLRGDIQGDGTTQATLDVLVSNIQPDKFEWLIGPNETVWLAVESSKVKVHIEATAHHDTPVVATGRIESSGPIGDFIAIIKGQYAPDGSAKGSAEITGTLCGGKLAADIEAARRPHAPVQLAMDASVEKVNMADLTRILAADKSMKTGTGKGMIRLKMSGLDRASTTGRGAFFLDDADLWQVPILSALFKHMKLKLDQADVQGSFDLAGTTATTITGQLATMVWAADFEKGGTIDYDSGKVDMYVMFLPIKQAGILLNFVKAINPLKLIAKQVLRLHVTGTRDAPRITPVPFSDLTKLPAGALGLLKSVTTSGGQLGGDIFKAVFNGGN